MQCNRPVTQISAGPGLAIHSYFDLCPESPDGQWVVYFRFNDKPPAVGAVMVASRDGTDHRVMAEGARGTAHGGAFQQWAGPQAIGYSTSDEGGACAVIASIADASRRRLDSAVRMFCPETGLGLVSSHELAIVGDAIPERAAVYLVDLESGARRPLFDVADCVADHPARAQIAGPEHYKFKHTKWAPDGQHFFVVFNNEGAARTGIDTPRIKALYLADADGAKPRFLTEFGHHPMWSGNGEYAYYFERAEGGGQDLVAFYPKSGERQVLLGGIEGCHSSLSPDSKWLVADAYRWGGVEDAGVLLLYEMGAGKQEVLAEFTVRDLTHQTGCHAHPVWSRDGRRVYFNCAEDDNPRLFALDL